MLHIDLNVDTFDFNIAISMHTVYVQSSGNLYYILAFFLIIVSLSATVCYWKSWVNSTFYIE